MSASAARSRIPSALAIFGLVGGGLWWQTAGGSPEPKSRANGDARLSGALHQMARTGGPHARAEDELERDTKDTRVFSSTSDVHSKKSHDKPSTGSTSQGAVLDKKSGDGGKSGRERQQTGGDGDSIKGKEKKFETNKA